MSLVRRCIRIGTALAMLFPVPALALEQRFVQLGTGIKITYVEAIYNLIGFLAFSIELVGAALFLIGAFYMTASAGKPEMVETGKKLMKGSLIGMAIVLCSYTILRTVLWLIY